MRRQLLECILALCVMAILPAAVQAQIVTCLQPSGFPACDGSCLPGEACVNTGPECACLPATTPCEASGGPGCDGQCPPDHACQLLSSGCQCALVPTLSTWGIGAMAALLMGFVLVRAGRRRRRLGEPSQA